MPRLKALGWTVALLAASLAWPLTRAAAHEKGVLKLPSRELAPGDSVRVAGEQFGARTELRLVLVGAAGRITLGTVRTDTAGAFATRLEIPSDAALGPYRLLALAPDGDEAATFDVALVPRPASHGHTTNPEAAARPSPEPLDLERARSPAVTAGALLGIAVALIGWIALLRRGTAAAFPIHQNPTEEG